MITLAHQYPCEHCGAREGARLALSDGTVRCDHCVGSDKL